MSKLPAVRLPSVLHADGESEGQEAVVVELPPSNKFSFAWPSEPPASFPLPVLADRPPDLSSSDQESGLSETESNGFLHSSDEKEDVVKRKRGDGHVEETDFTPTNRLYNEQNPMDQAAVPPPPLPRLSRAFSVPLPSQVDHLKNPRRTTATSERADYPSSPRPIELSPELSQFHELSLELADSVQMVIQMLLQLSPPQVLDPAKEQFSACSLPIPTPSITAMFTSMKNLNYMSANIASFSMPHQPPRPKLNPEDPTPPHSPASILTPIQIVDFDIGEAIQNVGDAVSGIAAEAGIDLVLFHGDVGMKHIAVQGDESGLSYTLSHIIRQIISTAHRGDCIEIGLYIVAPPRDRPLDPDTDDTQPVSGTTSPDPDVPLRCTFTITHVFPPRLDSSNPLVDSWSDRDQPLWNSLILTRLLKHIDALFELEEPASTAVSSTRTCKLTLTMDRGSPSVVNPAVVVAQDDPFMQALSGFQIAGEPTLEELGQFTETLRGKKASLYASSKGEFAHHLTSYLTAWGLDVSHVSSDSVDEEEEAARESPELSNGTMKTEVSFGSGSALETLPEAGPVSGSTPASSPGGQGNPQQPSFILIDDDVSVLRTQLRAMKTEQQQPYPLHIGSRKRPSLSAHHRPRSSPQVARAMGLNAMPQPRNTGVIIHFTSLANFKLVKGIIQTTLGPNGTPILRMPEVIVIPKPAGPRRVLTALHTAATKPTVDPFFSPIATSPMSPSVQSAPSYPGNSPRSPHGRPASSPRTNSERSLRSPKDHPGETEARLAPPSPLGLSEGMDYFSEAAVKLGTSPSSGLVIQSPDGQPAGIFFHPKARARTAGGEKRSSFTGGQPQFFSIEKSNRGAMESPRRTSETEDRDRTRVGIAYLAAPSKLSTPRRSPVQLVPIESSTEDAGKSGPSSSSKMGRLSSPAPNTPAADTSSGLPTPVPAGPSVSSSPNSPQPQPLTPRLLAPRKSNTMDTLRKTSSPPHSPRNVSPTTPASATSMSMSRRASARRGMSSEIKQVEKGTQGGTGLGVGGVGSSKGGQEATIVPPISVLVVDDNPINQTILSTFMKKKKIKYDVAKNGQEAVEKWKSGRFHLILMDIQMPVMDGIAATKEIRRLEKINAALGFPSTPQSEGARTPSDAESRISASPYRSAVIIVALTASSLQSDRVAALAAGCNDFLTKPVSLIWLNSKIIEWGSIKALQMWADIRPEVVRGQSQQAQNVARKLHVPEGRATPAGGSPRSASRSPSQVRQSTSGGGVPVMPALALAASSSSSSSPASGLAKGLANHLAQISESPTSFEFPRPSSREDTSLQVHTGDSSRKNSLDPPSRIHRVDSGDSSPSPIPRIQRSGTEETAESLPSPSFSSPEKSTTPVTALEEQSPRSPATTNTNTAVTALEELSPRSPMAMMLDPPAVDSAPETEVEVEAETETEPGSAPATDPEAERPSAAGVNGTGEGPSSPNPSTSSSSGRSHHTTDETQ